MKDLRSQILEELETSLLDLGHPAPSPALGSYAAGFEPVAREFARQLDSGEQIGGAFAVYHRGEPVVRVWGGLADVYARRPWQADTRIVVFSVTKGFAAMGFHVLADRGAFDWDAPVAEYWPGFAKNGKANISVRTLLNHRAGLPYLEQPLSLSQLTSTPQAPAVVEALEAQRPIWTPDEGQGYHALTFGMYASELFRRIAEEPLGPFLRRELFEPLGSDVMLGTPPSQDRKVATLYPPPHSERAVQMLKTSVRNPNSTEARMLRAVLAPSSIPRRAFANPATGPGGVGVYNESPVRRTELAWASATASADGVARAYLPFANDGEHGGRRYFSRASLLPVYERQGWSAMDAVLQKPVGWSGGFLKEEPHLFSPNIESFGHAGMGGTLGWADPEARLSFGYVMNRMDWRIRSPRALALCHALYRCALVG